MSKVLFISYDGLTDQLGQSQILPYVMGMQEAGYQMSILSFEKPSALYSREEIQQQMDQAGIQWYPQSYTKNPPVISTYLDVRRLFQVSRKIIRQEGIQMTHCRSYIPALAGLKAKRELGTKMVFDMRGFWADERVDGGLWSLSNPLYRRIYNYFKRKEAEFLVESDHIISLTHAGKEEMLTWKNANQFAPISIIPCSVDNDFFSPKNVIAQEVEALRKELKLSEEDKVLIYLGSIGTWYMLDEMLTFYKAILELDRTWKFVFLTREQEAVKSKAKSMGIASESLRITSAQRQEIPAYLSLANWGIFFIKPSYSKKSSSPTKQGEIMSMGIPLISNSGVGDCDRIIEKYQAGIVLNEMSQSGYQKGLELMNSFEFSEDLISTGAKDYFSLEKALETYRSVYQIVLDH